MNVTEGLSFLQSLFTNVLVPAFFFFFWDKVCLVTTVNHNEIIDLGILISCFSKIKENFINLSKEHKS